MMASSHDWTKAVSFWPYAKQPWKSLFVLWTVSAFLPRLLYYALISLPRSWRPLPSWSFQRAYYIRVIRYWDSLKDEVGWVFGGTPYDHTKLAEDKVDGEPVKGVWVDPAPSMITGSLELWANIASTPPIRIPGYWIHRRQTTIEIGAAPMPGEKVIYFFHGGGYVQLSAHPNSITSAIPKSLIKHCDTVQRTFAIEYRLSVGPPNEPAHSFPAALLDALAGYNYLVNVVGFSPSDIILVGDSAGGNLAHALTRYLVEYRNTTAVHLPAPPGGLLLCSPWVDIGSSHFYPNSSVFTNPKSDFIVDNVQSYSKSAFVGIHGMGAAATNRYVSPASLDATGVSFKGFPKTFIANGGAEVLRDQIRCLRDRMVRDIGSDCVYFEAEDVPHDFLLFDFCEPQRSETLQAISKWLSAL